MNSRTRADGVIAATVGALLSVTGLVADARPPVAGFIDQPVTAGFNRGVGMTFDASGRIFVWEQTGRVLIVENGVIRPQPLIDLSPEVYNYVQLGLLGFALDPDFETNGYFYMLYAVDWAFYTEGGPPAVPDQQRDTFTRLTRYTADPATNRSTTLPGSRFVMIGATHETGFPCTSGSHGPGSIIFARDGTMLLSHGDGASWQQPYDVGGMRDPGPQGNSSNTAEIDGIIGPREQVGAYRAQLVGSHSGKILRLDPATGFGVPSNPFFDPMAPGSPRSRVWALGLRNPYRFDARPGTGSTDPADANPGSLYIGDVGWYRWEELSIARRAGGGENFGWPIFEGVLPSPDYPGQLIANLDAPNPLFGTTPPGQGLCGLEFFRFTDLLKQESNNPLSFPNPCDPSQQIAGAFTFEHTRPAFDYSHQTSQVRLPIFDMAGEAATINLGAPGAPAGGAPFQGVSVLGGDWFTGNGFPPEYRDTYFFGDTYWSFLRAARFDAQDRLIDIRPFATFSAFPVAIAAAPDGSGLYYLAYGGFGALRRIVADCNGNNQADVDEIRTCTGSVLCADCNANGLLDSCDISSGRAVDRNSNGVPDECEPPACPGDANFDGMVGLADIAVIIINWSSSVVPTTNGDVNFDGVVNLQDIALTILHFATTCE